VTSKRKKAIEAPRMAAIEAVANAVFEAASKANALAAKKAQRKTEADAGIRATAEYAQLEHAMQQDPGNSKLEDGKLMLRCARRCGVEPGAGKCENGLYRADDIHGQGEMCNVWFSPSTNDSDACKGGEGGEGHPPAGACLGQYEDAPEDATDWHTQEVCAR